MSESGIHVFESRHAPGFRMTPERHRFPELLYVRHGRGTVTLTTRDGPSRAARCAPGDAVLIPTGSTHVVIDDPGHPLWLYGLAVDPGRIPPFAALEALFPSGLHHDVRTRLPDIESRFRRLLYLAEGDRPAKVAALGGALELFAAFADENASRPADETTDAEDPLESYLRWLARNFFEQLTVEDAARRCHMSRRAFTGAIKRRTGRTWLVHLHELRVAHAVELLESTDAPVTSIAFRVGFEELSTFYRVFRRVTGRRPGEYRQEKDEPATDGGN